jgi:hypothetical protein
MMVNKLDYLQNDLQLFRGQFWNSLLMLQHHNSLLAKIGNGQKNKHGSEIGMQQSDMFNKGKMKTSYRHIEV